MAVSNLAATSSEDGIRRFLQDTLAVTETRSARDVVHADFNKVVGAVTTGRFRRSALSDYSRADVCRKISEAFADERELIFTVPFGCYKSWRIKSHPKPNWAEVFSLSYLARYLDQIALVYPFGVGIEFTHISGVMDIVSNHDSAWESVYVRGFESLCALFSTDEYRFSLVDLVDVGDMSSDHRAALCRRAEELELVWDSRGDTGRDCERKLASAGRNLVPIGNADLSGASDAGWARLVRRSAILCDALDGTEFRRTYNKFEHRIQLVFVKGPEPSIHIGSTEASIGQFWVSDAALERRKGRFVRRLIGHTTKKSRTGGFLSEFDCSSVIAPSAVGNSCDLGFCFVVSEHGAQDAV